MEVGPLARLIVAYAAGKEPQKSIVDETLRQLDLPVDALFSTLGRTAARGLECRMAADWALEFFNQLIKNLENGIPGWQTVPNGNGRTGPIMSKA